MFLADGTYRMNVNSERDFVKVSYFEGYQVGCGTIAKSNNGFTREQVEDLLLKVQTKRDNYVEFGIWLDTDSGITYLDKCFNIDYLEEALEEARLNEELAVWDWANEVCLEVK